MEKENSTSHLTQVMMKKFLTPSRKQGFWTLFLGVLTVCSTFGQEKYFLAKRVFNFPERGEIHGYAALSRSNQLSFIPPKNFVTTMDASGSQITCRSEDARVSITIQISTNPPASLNNLAELKEKIAGRFSNANLFHQQTLTINGRKAFAFDLERVASNQMMWNTRIVLIEFQEGTIEFAFSTAAKDFNSHLLLFADFLNSFEGRERSVLK